MGMLLLSSTRPSMEKDRTRSGWMILTVPVTRSPCLTVHIEVLESMTVTTMKMLVLFAQVTYALIFLALIYAQVILDKPDINLFNFLLTRECETD